MYCFCSDVINLLCEIPLLYFKEDWSEIAYKSFY